MFRHPVEALDSGSLCGFNTRLSRSARSATHARVAQSVEQWIENPRVGGSIPPPGTININTSTTHKVIPVGDQRGPVIPVDALAELE
jgi:hypothetical protein